MKLRELYKCNTCGNVVEVAYTGVPTLACCSEDMERLEAQTEDATTEKHVPVIKEFEDGIEVIVGTTIHPMEENHYISFIEVLTEERILRAELKPSQEPKAKFPVTKSEVVKVREYCNIHGLWKD